MHREPLGGGRLGRVVGGEVAAVAGRQQERRQAVESRVGWERNGQVER